jgi:hypothetical protein
VALGGRERSGGDRHAAAQRDDGMRARVDEDALVRARGRAVEAQRHAGRGAGEHDQDPRRPRLERAQARLRRREHVGGAAACGARRVPVERRGVAEAAEMLVAEGEVEQDLRGAAGAGDLLEAGQRVGPAAGGLERPALREPDAKRARRVLVLGGRRCSARRGREQRRGERRRDARAPAAGGARGRSRAHVQNPGRVMPRLRRRAAGQGRGGGRRGATSRSAPAPSIAQLEAEAAERAAA